MDAQLKVSNFSNVKSVVIGALYLQWTGQGTMSSSYWKLSRKRQVGRRFRGPWSESRTKRSNASITRFRASPAGHNQPKRHYIASSKRPHVIRREYITGWTPPASKKQPIYSGPLITLGSLFLQVRRAGSSTSTISLSPTTRRMREKTSFHWPMPWA